jgi:hypothetical protein
MELIPRTSLYRSSGKSTNAKKCEKAITYLSALGGRLAAPQRLVGKPVNYIFDKTSDCLLLANVLF